MCTENLPRMQTNSSHLPLFAATNVITVCLSLVFVVIFVACSYGKVIYPERYQRFCVAKKFYTLTTERNKTALAVPKQSNLFIGTWELQISSKQKCALQEYVQHAEHDKCTSLLYEVYSSTDIDACL